jgi:hypothetical protein
MCESNGSKPIKNESYLELYDLKLSRRHELIKPSLAISRVNKLKLVDVSGMISVPIIRATDI